MRQCLGLYLRCFSLTTVVFLIAGPVDSSHLTSVTPATSTFVVPDGFNMINVGAAMLLAKDIGKLKGNESHCLPGSHRPEMSEADFFGLIGRALGSDQRDQKEVAKQTLISAGCTAFQETTFPPARAAKQLKAMSKSCENYRMLAMYLPGVVRDHDGKSMTAASLMSSSWYNTFLQSGSKSKLSPDKLNDVDFKDCVFKDEIVCMSKAQPDSVSVFDKYGFQVNTGAVEGQCLTKAENKRMGLLPRSFPCVPKAYGDLSVVFSKGNAIKVVTFQKVIRMGQQCIEPSQLSPDDRRYLKSKKPIKRAFRRSGKQRG